MLGDSATIITETDPKKLKDLVADLEPQIPAAEPEPEETSDNATVATPARDTAQAPPVKDQPKAQPDVAGLKAEFKDVTVLIPGLNGKLAGNPNLQRANGAVYTFNSGDIDGNEIRVTGDVTKVSMRYQTAVVLKNDMGTFPIDALSETTDWEPLRGGNNAYKITGLGERDLEYTDAGPAAIRNAVARMAQRRRMSRKKVQEITNSVRNVRSANQRPLSVVLRSVMWKIDGKDANGRSFSKQIRVDIPL